MGQMPEGDLQAALALTSPPFRQTSGGTNPHESLGPRAAEFIARHAAGNAAAHGYGEADGNIANLPEGELSIAISSPPFLNQVQAQDPAYQSAGEGHGARHSDYGSSPTQLARLPEGDAPDGAALAVSSPPYEDQQVHSRQPDYLPQKSIYYSESEDNTGNMSGETFWSASALIAAETFAALCPGAHACWVLKAFVRDGALVDFPAQWRALTESVGFVTLHEHHP